MTAHKDPLSHAKEVIKAQQEELQRIAQTALETATVLWRETVKKESFLYVVSNAAPFRVMDVPKMGIEPGDSVLVFQETNQIIEKINTFPSSGNISVVSRAGEVTSEVRSEGNLISVLNGKGKTKDGDRVVLNSTNHIILLNLGPEKDKKLANNIPNVQWDDIGGLENAKAEMVEAIELPHLNKEIYLHYNKRIAKGILLYGPPGTGKTLLAKAAANALARIYEGKNGSENAFIHIKGPEILNKYVGESEATVRSLFERAKAHKSEFGYPAVIFIDEAESILARRGRENGSYMTDTIVPMFLTEMDGMEESNALVILATNRQDILDPAITRDGRIDRKIKISRPDRESAIEIIKMNLTKTILAKGLKMDDVCAEVVKEIFSKEREVQDGIKLRHPVNGAMLAGIVDKAISYAIRRDIMSNKKSGVTLEDLMQAVDTTQDENRDMNHEAVEEELKEAA